MKLDRNTINQIKGIDLLDVVESYIEVKRAGSAYKALCPFHDEKTPSFNINPKMGICKCFGCGWSGDIISFIEEIEAVTFMEAIRLLADKHNIELPDGSSDINATHKITDLTQYYFESAYKLSPAHKLALKRGYGSEVQKLFRFGYAPDSWDMLTNSLRRKGYEYKDMVSASVVREGNRYYDFFRNRLTVPIINHVGTIVGFTARALGDDNPKYINSTETDIYTKGKVLFGLYQSKHSIKRLNQAIVVEGALDVVGLFEAKIDNVVASLGTAFTKEQISLLKRYTDNVVLMYDGDTAGLKAVFKACEPLLEQGMFVKVLRLNEGTDPDDFRKGKTEGEIREYIEENSKDWISFRLELLSNSVSDKVRLASELKRMIAKFPDAEGRVIMYNSFAEKFGLPKQVVRKSRANTVSKSYQSLTEEEDLARILIEYGLEAVLEHFENVGTYTLQFIEDKLIKWVCEQIMIGDRKTVTDFRDIKNGMVVDRLRTILTKQVSCDMDVDIKLTMWRFEKMAVNKLIIKGATDREWFARRSELISAYKDIEDAMAKIVRDRLSVIN